MLEIEHQVYIEKPVEVVYDALTSPECWNAWFTSKCEMGSQVGERITFEWLDYGIDHQTIADGGEITRLERPTSFAFTWSPGVTATEVAFELAGRGSGTIVSLHETGYSKSDEDFIAFKACSVGWGEALTLLKFYLEHGITYGEVPRACLAPGENG